MSRATSVTPWCHRQAAGERLEHRVGEGVAAALDLPGLREMCADAAVLAPTPDALGREAAATRRP